MKRFSLLLFTFFIINLSFSQTRKVDILVYGGTSAGVIAAYSAKKLGKSVLLIEPSRHLGGLSSGGLGQTDIGNKFAITGLSREFYKRIGKHYGVDEQWIFEPHVAEKVFKEFIAEAKVTVLLSKRLVSVSKKGATILNITLEDSEKYSKSKLRVIASQFIDCSYEGDLLAMAGVSYTVGREANSQYGETYNGVQLLDKHQFPDGIDPYRIPGKPESGLLWGISDAKLLPNGSADKSVQAYNFRLCLTTNKANQVQITKPFGYDATKYELLLRQIAKTNPKELTWQLMHIQPMPNNKTDINNCGGFSTDMIGANYNYAEANYAQRKQIIKEHEIYTKGLLYFIGHDSRVPEHLRNEMLRYGYPKDEYIDNEHFTPQLYIREARRMVSDYVMTQANCQGKVVATHPIGMAAYTMDSHNCQRLVINGMVKNEGDVQVGGFPPYPIDYGSIIPKANECTNLTVPVCLSASHIAYGSIRMEPVFMVLGQSAAMAAAQAIDEKTTIQKINFNILKENLVNNPILAK
jgi:FAD dependent oxidoreductase